LSEDTAPQDEPWQSWIARKTEVIFCEDEVNWPQIKYFCSAVQDANPIYWDRYEAEKRFGSIISPPGMIMVWSMPQPWRPDGARALPMLAIEVPAPGDTIINASTETEFLKPVRVGDRLNFQEEIVEVSPEKKTRLGVGRFITAMTTYRNQSGEVVARHKNILFRYFTNASENGGGE
jgi:acyl dehydratase